MQRFECNAHGSILPLGSCDSSLTYFRFQFAPLSITLANWSFGDSALNYFRLEPTPQSITLMSWEHAAILSF